MSNILNISEALSMALHTAVFLAARPGNLISNKEIASVLQVSEAHLSKVLQRLVKFGFVKSIRGPKGGFMIGKSGDEITLLDIYKAIEGPIEPDDCLLRNHVCGGKDCILGDLVKKINSQVKEYLSSTKLNQLSKVYVNKI